MLSTTGRTSYGEQLARAARIRPQGVALLTGDEACTYAELDDRASRVAGALRDFGLGRGDRAALFLTNQPAFVEAFTGGWFHSGGLARRDDDGLIWIVDREKDVIVSSGENIYRVEVEAAVSEHPGVAETAVIGVPHERRGETPCAVIVPAGPARPSRLDEVVAHCATRLASYKKPTDVRIVSALPCNANGKVQRFRLRAEAAD